MRGKREEGKRVFISYAHEDDDLRQKLEQLLSLLRMQNLIQIWHDQDINAGTEWEREINTYLKIADIVLLLISPDFLASKYCYGIEMEYAMERHERGEAHVIPIIMRPVHWQGTPFSKLQVLPTGAKAIQSSSWPYLDEALFNVVEGIRKVIEAPLVQEIRLHQTFNKKEEILALDNTSLPAIKIIASDQQAKIYNERANKLIQLAKHEEALIVLDQALSFNPADAEVHALKGYALNQLDRYEEALIVLDQALSLNPACARAYRQKSFALNHCGRYQDALLVLDQLIILDPTSAIAYARKGYALNQLDRYEEALIVLDQALSLNPNDPWIHMLKGYALKKLGRYEEALTTLDLAVSLDPTDVQVKNLRSGVLQHLKQ